LSTKTQPSTYAQASRFECWHNAMSNELATLEETKTWTLVDLPPNVKPIGNKWVFKIKRHADGSVELYKAQLVAKGFTQTEGLDYFDIFSPIAKMTTLRLLSF